MAALIVTAGGQVTPKVAANVTNFSLYICVTKRSDGSPVTGLSANAFSIKAFTTPNMVAPIGSNASEKDRGVYFVDGVIPGLSLQAFLVSVQFSGDQGQVVGGAVKL